MNINQLSILNFNSLQRTACQIGDKKPIYCYCKGAGCDHIDDNGSPILKECVDCNRLFPLCFLDEDDGVCCRCYYLKNKGK